MSSSGYVTIIFLGQPKFNHEYTKNGLTDSSAQDYKTSANMVVNVNRRRKNVQVKK